MTKICIFGGAGYVGAVMTEQMLKKGYEVTVVDNLMYGQSNPLFHLFHNKNLKFVYGDVTSVKFLYDFFEQNKFDFIVPLSAIVGFPISEQKPEYTYDVNVKSIGDMILNTGKDTKILFPNTNSGYGMTDGTTECTEEQELKPISTYGKTKCQAEAIIRDSGKEWVVFRLATVFGMSPRMRTDLLVNNFVLRAYRDKTLVLFERNFKRNFIHVRDVGRAFIYAIEHWDKMKNNVYNLGHPDFNITKLELADLIKKEVPDLNIFFGEGKDPDKRNYIVSNRKILATGFRFKYPLDIGIREILAGYNAMRDYRYKNCDDSG